MIGWASLRRATLIGTVLQIAMVVAGHYVPAITASFMWGGLAISLLAGLLYGRNASGFGGGALGGAIAGGVCALLGIAVSVWLKGVPAQVLLFGTIGSAVTGLIGGLIGRALKRS
ncbi:MAG TPA: hypothetical protein VGF56_12475 [Rhizomicrobium sp.]|jgi:hypothetical protein